MQTRKRTFPSIEQRRMLGYARVSTADQQEHGISLEAQHAAIEAEAARQGWCLVGIHQDVLSAKSTNGRHGLAAALAAIEAGQADGLIVTRLDRLSRSIVDFAQLMERARQGGWSLVLMDLAVDTATPLGELVAHIMASLAQFERKQIGARTKEALAYKKSQGVRLGRPRLLTSETARWVRTLRRRGLSLVAIAERLNGDGVATPASGKQWHATTVRRALVS